MGAAVISFVDVSIKPWGFHLIFAETFVLQNQSSLLRLCVCVLVVHRSQMKVPFVDHSVTPEIDLGTIKKSMLWGPLAKEAPNISPSWN